MNAPASGLRTALALGRVSNLPTVWSNLLAGWILARGGHDPAALAMLLAGGSSLYIGGMFLNDFCDAEFDAVYRKERPIPAGKISRRAVGLLAGLWFACGLACLVPFGPPAVVLALLLIAAIVLYDFRHKDVPAAPLVMGFCRFLLYLLAGSASLNFPVWSQVLVPGTALGLYVAGITFLARGESRPEKTARWALLLLVLPVPAAPGLAAVHHLPLAPPLLCSLLLLGWMALLLVPLWRKTNPSIGRVVAGLLAGIVLVDLVALAPMLGAGAAWFLVLFALALLLQRSIPAT